MRRRLVALLRFPAVVRGRRGVAAVEFALVVPVLMLLLFAAIDYGRAIDQSMRLDNALRAGAQYALSYPDDAGAITSRVDAALGGMTGVTVTAECECGTSAPSAASCTTICSTTRVITLRASRPFTPYFFRTITTVRGNVTLRFQ